MTRVIAYLRVSKEIQENENQKFGFEKFCTRMDLNITEWVEEKISGSANVKDRIMGELVPTLKRGDIMIFSEFSRIGRSIYSIFATLKECIDRGAIIYTVKENFRLSDDIHGKITSTMLGLISDIERSLNIERVRETYQRKKKEADARFEKVRWGRSVGAKTKMEKRLLTPHHKRIVELRQKGITLEKIALAIGVNRRTVTKYVRDCKI